MSLLTAQSQQGRQDSGTILSLAEKVEIFAEKLIEQVCSDLVGEFLAYSTDRISLNKNTNSGDQSDSEQE